MHLKNRVLMVDVQTLLIMATVKYIRQQPVTLLINTGNGSHCTTHGCGAGSVSVNSQKNPGALNVCARTSTLLQLSAIISTLTVAIKKSFSKGHSNLYANLVILKRQTKSWGGVAKMFESGERIAGVACISKKTPNVRISAIGVWRRFDYARS
jgi:hypothetical protein